MLAYLIITAAIAFWLGIKCSRLLSAALNKHYARAFYVPRTAIRVSAIGDCEVTTVAICKAQKEYETAYVQLYGYCTLTLEFDVITFKAQAESTRLCLHDFAMLMPESVRYDPLTSRAKLLYRLPRALTVNEVLHIWFFN